MQIYAFDSQGVLTHVHQAPRKGTYHCPSCKGPLRIRGGRLRTLHFYHVASSLCAHHGKSATHLHIQYALQKMLAHEKIFLEHSFPEIKRIADVVYPSHRLIFEIQVSPISATEVLARNRDYRQIGYEVIWILHDRQFNRTKLTAAESILRSSPHYFTNINAFGKGIFYDQYASIRFKRREQRSRRYPVRFIRPIPIQIKQLPRHFPSIRKKWPFSFEGDLFHRHFNESHSNKKSYYFFAKLFKGYKILLHLLLEKTTK